MRFLIFVIIILITFLNFHLGECYSFNNDHINFLHSLGINDISEVTENENGEKVFYYDDEKIIVSVDENNGINGVFLGDERRRLWSDTKGKTGKLKVERVAEKYDNRERRKKSKFVVEYETELDDLFRPYCIKNENNIIKLKNIVIDGTALQDVIQNWIDESITEYENFVVEKKKSFEIKKAELTLEIAECLKGVAEYATDNLYSIYRTEREYWDYINEFGMPRDDEYDKWSYNLTGYYHHTYSAIDGSHMLFFCVHSSYDEFRNHVYWIQ